MREAEKIKHGPGSVDGMSTLLSPDAMFDRALEIVRETQPGVVLLNDMHTEEQIIDMFNKSGRNIIAGFVTRENRIVRGDDGSVRTDPMRIGGSLSSR